MRHADGERGAQARVARSAPSTSSRRDVRTARLHQAREAAGPVQVPVRVERAAVLRAEPAVASNASSRGTLW